MGQMKKYKYPTTCLTTDHVIRYGYRKKTMRLFCRSCCRSFSVNPHFLDTKAILYDHLDGLSFRKLAVRYEMSHMNVWRICEEELRKLPNNNQFTFKYCNRFSKIFLFDGKYFNIADQSHDWVLLWGVDYFRHDIPVFTIAPAETYQTWGRYFAQMRILNLHPKLLVCDDHMGLRLAARYCFPQAKLQTCYNHFKENIRRDLHVQSDEGKEKYHNFMARIESILDSKEKISTYNFNYWLSCLLRDYKHDSICLSILTNPEKFKKELLSNHPTC